MPAPLNLIGQCFGRLIVLAKTESNAHGQSVVLCRCVCGTERTVVSASLTAGHTKSCGCLAREIAAQLHFTDLTGRCFGLLTVLTRQGRGAKRKALWLCRCICGAEKVVIGNSLLSGNTKSCGCLKEKIEKTRKGKDCPSWKGGATPKNQVIRTSEEYKNWRKAVFARDDYACQECKTRGGKLHAHHVKAFVAFPELRLEISNGQTLCVPCHEKTPNYGNKKHAQTS